MRRLAVGGVGLVMLLVASPARAQDAAGTAVQFGVGGGLSLPLGDFDDFAKTGWHGTALVSIQPATVPIGFQIDGNFSQFSDDTPLDLKEQLIYGTGNIVYTFQTAEESKFHPYLIGGGGVYNAKLKGDDSPTDESTTKFGINAGAGFDFSVGSAGLFVEGRFHDVFTEGSNLKFIPITVGVRFGGHGA
jgi:Outer membrane protein beta-barrel domain